MRIFLFIVSCLWFAASFAQNDVKINGAVTNEQGDKLEGVNISVINSSEKAVTDKNGHYLLVVPRSAIPITLLFTRTGYIALVATQPTHEAIIQKDVVLIRTVNNLDSVIVTGERNRLGDFTINSQTIKSFSSVSGSFESVLKTLPGVSTNNELSSQYSVRGGNFDENLVYINDVEIFRPSLIRSGQQEGLSFTNSDLVSKASFFAGGFEARYGDKLSSVLDVKYSRPDSTEITAAAGLLGFSASTKLPFKKSYFLAGVRTKTNKNILNTQPVTGSYQPRFYDIQGLYSISPTDKLNLSVFGNYNQSSFQLIPESRETTFGTISEQFNLKINYEGSQKDEYISSVAAFTLTYLPTPNSSLKWISSVSNSDERETYDLEGSYVFDKLQTDYEGFENVRTNRGIGINYQHARNELKSNIYSSELRFTQQARRSFWEAGLRYRFDDISDKLNEYQLVDSAGFSLPNVPGDFVLPEVIKAENSVATNYVISFFQNTFQFSNRFTLAAGLRSNYNFETEELLLSPRLNALYRPANGDLQFRFAAGAYHQPPFYRELRNFNGSLTAESRSQKSIHLIAASDYYFNRFNTRLKFTSELYYKKLYELIPYKIEDLRVRYFADQQSQGYAIGADFSLNGDFVPGLESSFRLSFMKTREDIANDFYEQTDGTGNVITVKPGYLKRPTDQRINFSAFFQDQLFNNESYKVHLNILYGSALPTGPPQSQRYQDVFKIPAYKRVDIGFSKNFLEGSSARRLKFMGRYFHSLIAYAEVFNLLNINNTVSYLWIKDVNNNRFAIPNYLTSRQLNLKIIAKVKD